MPVSEMTTKSGAETASAIVDRKLLKMEYNRGYYDPYDHAFPTLPPPSGEPRGVVVSRG